MRVRAPVAAVAFGVVTVAVAEACFPSIAYRAGGIVEPDGSGAAPGDAAGSGLFDASIVSPSDAALQVEPGISRIGVSEGAACFLEDGQVLCWGDNGNGIFGSGSLDGDDRAPGDPAWSHVPVLVIDAQKKPLTGVADLSVGANHACAIVAADGSVLCWGWNDFGQTGIADGPQRIFVATSTRPGVTDAVSVHAGVDSTCARRRNGDTLCWGDPSAAQLTEALSSSERWVAPKLVPTLHGASTMALGSRFGCAVLEGGTACWGLNDLGQTGSHDHDVHYDDQWGSGKRDVLCVPTPQPVLGVSGTLRITAGAGHACAIDGPGEVRCWGSNARGQAGGMDADGGVPATALPTLGFATATAVAAGRDTTCAVKQGKVYCWGDNSNCELGLGGNYDTVPHLPTTPVQMLGGGDLDGVVLLAVGYHSCAVTQAKEVWCWGFKGPGEAGVFGDTADNAPEAKRVYPVPK